MKSREITSWIVVASSAYSRLRSGAGDLAGAAWADSRRRDDKRFRAARGRLNNIIRANGIDWISRARSICRRLRGRGNADFAAIRARVQKMADIGPPSRAPRYAASQGARPETDGNMVTAARQLVHATIHYGAAEWPMDDSARSIGRFIAEGATATPITRAWPTTRSRRSRSRSRKNDSGLVPVTPAPADRSARCSSAVPTTERRSIAGLLHRQPIDADRRARWRATFDRTLDRRRAVPVVAALVLPSELGMITALRPGIRRQSEPARIVFPLNGIETASILWSAKRGNWRSSRALAMKAPMLLAEIVIGPSAARSGSSPCTVVARRHHVAVGLGGARLGLAAYRGALEGRPDVGHFLHARPDGREVGIGLDPAGRPTDRASAADPVDSVGPDDIVKAPRLLREKSLVIAPPSESPRRRRRGRQRAPAP